MKDGDVKEELPEETAPAAVAVEVAVADGVKQEQPETSEQAADEAADGDQDGGDDDRQAGQAQRQSTRRKPHVDLGKLDIQTVRKYRRLFKIGDPQQPGSKEELLPAVVRHFQNLVIDEDETVLAFAFALRKQNGGMAAAFKSK